MISEHMRLLDTKAMRLLPSILTSLPGKLISPIVFAITLLMSLAGYSQTISGFTPTTGPSGTTVTVSGSGFTGASGVAFNGISSAFFVQSDGIILTQVPAGATTGLISVTVGANTVSSVDTFYVQQSTPTLTNFTPAAGPIGTNVTINGTNLNLIDSVRFNGVLATFNFVSASQITSIVPTGATTGPIEIFDNGVRYASASNFTVTLGTPAIISFDPVSGPTGTVVTIVGNNFLNASQVAFNGQISTNFQVISNDTIRATVPATATTGRIRIVTPGGQVQSFQNFTVTNTTAITIFGFNPNSGPVGTTVTITGQNLNGVTQLLFNGTPAVITSQTATQIVTTVPVGATTGFIVALAGAISATSNQQFTVTTASQGFCLNTQPQNINPTATWQTVTVPNARPTSFVFNAVAGSVYNFQTCGTRLNTVIRIYNQLGIELAMNDDNGPYCQTTAASLDFTVPTAGQYRVLVTESPCTALTATVNLQYRLSSTITTPTVTDFTPKVGPIGTLVSVNGFLLNNVTQVLVGSVPATQIISQTATSILFPIPTGATSNRITLNYATGSVTTVDSFFVTGNSFCAGNAILRGNIAPTSSWQASTAPAGGVAYWAFNATAGTTYSFSTCGATNDTKLYIYNQARVALDSNDNNGPLCAGNAASLQFTATTSGTYYVLLSNTGCVDLTAQTVLRYRTGAAFAVTSIDPTVGVVGTLVTVKGNGFVGITDVRFNNTTSAPGYTSVNDSTLTVAVPTGAQTGPICLYIGTASACSPQNFTVISLPVMCSSERYQGDLTMSTIVQYATLGAGFRDAYSFNATAGESYMLSTCDSPGLNDTKLRVYDAAGNVVIDNDDNGAYCQGTKASLRFSPTSTGTYYVLVTDTDCNPMSANGTLSYQQIPAALPPTITRFTPATGPVGTVVSIFGTNLTLTNQVTFNGTAAVIFNILSDTAITATVPNGATTGRISLTTANGSAISSSNFTVVNCSNVRIVFQITPQGGNQFRVVAAGGPINNLTFSLNGTQFNGQQPFTAFPGVHTVRATNQQGCFSEVSFRNYGVVPCGQRISGGGVGADTLGFYELAVPARGQSFLTLFDQGSVPERGRLFYSGGLVAALTPANNPTNLAYTLNNAATGTMVIEVKMRSGQTFGAWVNCPTFPANLILMGQGTQTCSRQLVLSSYPQRLTTVGNVTQVLNAGNGNVLQFNVRGLTLGTGDTLYLFNSIVINNSPIATFHGNMANVTNPIVISPDSIVTAYFVGNAGTRGGFVIDVNCISNTARSAVMGTLSSSNLCPGSQLTVPYTLVGNYTVPVPIEVELSDSPLFGTVTVIGRDTVNSLTGNLSSMIPFNQTSGTYYVRIKAAGAVNSSSSAISVSPQPMAPVIQPIGSPNICQGSFLTIAPTTTGASAYLWSDGSTNRLLRTNQAGVYTLRTVTGACTSDVSDPVLVTIKPVVTVRLRQSNDTIFINSPVPFDPTVTWFINGQAQTSFPSFWKATQSGAYHAIVNADGCFVNTDTLNIVSLANGLSMQTFSLYPNPASGVVTIQADPHTMTQGHDLILMNALGQVVRSQATRFAADDKLEISLEGLPAGQYWVSFSAAPQMRKALIVR